MKKLPSTEDFKLKFIVRIRSQIIELLDQDPHRNCCGSQKLIRMDAPVLQLLSQKAGGDLSISELKQLIGREINSCLQPGRHPSASDQQLAKLSAAEQLSKLSAAEQLTKLSSSAEQLPKLSSDVTLTKVAAPERLAEKEKEANKVRGCCCNCDVAVPVRPVGFSRIYRVMELPCKVPGSGSFKIKRVKNRSEYL